MNTANKKRQLEKLVLLSTFIGIAAAIGLAPASFFLNCKSLLLVFATEGLLVAALSFWLGDSDTPVGIGATNLEFLLRGLASVSLWGFLGVIWLCIYELLYGLVRFLGWLIGLLNFDIHLRADSIAYYGSLGFALIFAIGIALAIARNVSNRLYSVSVSSRSQAYATTLSKQRRVYLNATMSLLLLAAMGILLWYFDDSKRFSFYFFMQMVPYGACAWLLTLGQRVRKESEIVGAIGKLLEATGYEVIYSPRSQEQSLETLFTGVDIIALKDKLALIIQVKTISSSAEPVDWSAGFGLKMKAKALKLHGMSEKLDIVSLTEKSMYPLLILVDRVADESLQDFALDTNVALEIIDMAAINRILNTSSTDELMEMARELFPHLTAAAESGEALKEARPREKSQWA